MMLRVWIVIAVGLLVQAGYGQEDIRRLHIGDTMPPLVWKMLNDRDSTLNLGEVKSKLTILSFWTPACTISSGQLPQLERLQEAFSRDLRIIPVGFDGREEGATAKFVEGAKSTGKALQLGTAVQPFHDHSLYERLPFMGLPENVWLDSNHVIRAITDHLALTELHIREMMAGDHPKLELKDVDLAYDTDKLMLVNGNGGADSSFTYRSLVTPYKPFIAWGEHKVQTNAYTKVSVGNAVPLMLLLTAVSGYDTAGKLPEFDPMNKRLVNKIHNPLFDSAYYDLPPADYARAEELRKQQLFCYEVVLPPRFTYQQAYAKMLSDLCDYFRVDARIEKQQRAVLQMTAKGRIKKEGSSDQDEHIIISDDRLFYSFEHCSVKRIADVLNYFLEMPPLICSLPEEGKVSFSFTLTSRSDLRGLEKGLGGCGLQVKKKKAVIDMLVMKNR